MNKKYEDQYFEGHHSLLPQTHTHNNNEEVKKKMQLFIFSICCWENIQMTREREECACRRFSVLIESLLI
jgi:hypothetical protein